MTEQPKPSESKIYRSFVCERCGLELNSSEAYKQHKVDHTTGKVSDEVIDPVEGKVAEPEVTVIPSNTVPEVKPIVFEPVKDEPITLKYVFTGTCPTCSSAVETIPLDIDVDKQKKFVVIAWCGSCRKNIQQRMVSKL